MTKETLIGQVLLRVAGGRPTSDLAVRYPDVESYLPAAVNYALLGGYYDQQNQERDRDLPTQFYGRFDDLSVLTAGDRSYVELPAGLIAIPSNRALREVLTPSGRHFAPLNDNAMRNLDHWLTVFPDLLTYRLEGKKIYLYNAPVTVTKVSLTMLVAVEDLAPDAELPIPAGKEKDVLEILVELATGQRQLPTDARQDGRDIN